jgi:hypothetical protein
MNFSNGSRVLFAMGLGSCATAVAVTNGSNTAMCMPSTGSGPRIIHQLPKRKKAADKSKLECAPLLLALFSCYKVKRVRIVRFILVQNDFLNADL